MIFHRLFARIFPLLMTLLLMSCGGSSDWLSASGIGVGTGGTGFVSGTITGLGSIYIDGVRYDESQAVLEQGSSDLSKTEAIQVSDLQVGQYALLELNAQGTLVRVRIDSQLVGTVSAIAQYEKQITVWGQKVQLNTDPTQGPVTVLAGYPRLEDMKVEDRVQIYGVLQTDPQDSSRDLIRASRIEKLDPANTLSARITGTLRGSENQPMLAGRAFPTKETTGALITTVVPWEQEKDPHSAPWQVQATRNLGSSALATDKLRLSGLVQIGENGVVMVQGVPIDTSSTALDAIRPQLRTGTYITINGSVNQQTGKLVANTIETTPQGGRVQELHGTVSAWVDLSSFTLRGIHINASRAQWGEGTPADLRDGRYVEVMGTVSGNTFQATRISVPNAPPPVRP